MDRDALIDFEDQNYDWLIDTFLKKYQEEWQELVESEFNKRQQDKEEDR